MAKKVHETALTVDEMKKRMLKARTMLAEIRATFPEARKLARDDRRTSQGRMGVTENKALRSVVDAMDEEPAIFNALADEDEGHDPNKLETTLLRDRFERHEVYMTLAEELEEIAQVFSDTALAVGALVKPVVQAGYEIAKPLSKRHAAIREKITPALDYYGANAAASAATRAANKAAKNDD